MIATPRFVRRRRLQLCETHEDRFRLRLRFWLQDVNAWLDLPRGLVMVFFTIGFTGLVVRWALHTLRPDEFIDVYNSIWLDLSVGMTMLSISVLLIGWASESVTTKRQRISKLADLTALDSDLALWTLAGIRIRGWLSDGTLAGQRLDHLSLPDTNLMTPIIEEEEHGETEVYLQPADLSKAQLRRAVLRGATLDGADLSRADLRNADLRGASLVGADLRGTDLRGADLGDANLDYAVLEGPEPLTSDSTVMPHATSVQTADTAHA